MGSRLRALAVSVVAILLFIGPASAQDWPARPLTLVVAFPSGGSDDILGRIVAARLSELLGQPVIVENVSGGGGSTGTARVATAAPDGYQLMLGTSATHALSQVLRRNPPYDSTADFIPVALIAEQPFILIARKDLPVEGLREFITYAQAPGIRMQYGSAGEGSATHLVCALLNTAGRIEAKHMPYDGGPASLRDLVAGRIDYFCPVVTIAIPQIENKGVKPIAILAKKRPPILADLATASEQGLADFDANTWFAVFLPKGTPARIVGILHAALMATMDTPGVQARLSQIGAHVVTPERRTPDYLRAFLQSEIDKWAAAIKSANVKVD